LEIEFMAIINPSTTALKVSGNGSGGTLVLAFDDSQLPQVLKTTLLRERLLKVKIEPVEE
jgi:hypothetical protein